MPADQNAPVGLFDTGQGSTRAEVINLNEVADREALSVEDRIALQDADLRRRVGDRIVWTFIGGNFVMLTVLAGLVYLDQSNLGSHVITPDQRIITDKVVMALLGATTRSARSQLSSPVSVSRSRRLAIKSFVAGESRNVDTLG